jgi:hypothetical protein
MAVARRYADQWARMDGSLTCLAALAFSEADIAAQAWEEACSLQRSDEAIRFIRAPDDRILTMRELKDLAESESN